MSMATDSESSTAAGWHAHRDELAEWAAKHMVNRTDCCGAYTSPEVRGTIGANGKEVPTSYTCKQGLSIDRLRAHFSSWSKSENVIGVHTIGLDDTCKTVSVDVDNHSSEDDGNTRERNLRFALACHEELDRLGLRPLLWDSNGKGGYHLDVIFSEPIPADHAYRFGRWIVRRWAEFGFVGQPESFPKQPSRGDGYGNWLRLIGRHHTRNIWATVYDAESGECVQGEAAALTVLAHQPVSRAAIPPEAIQAPETPKRPSTPIQYAGTLDDDIETATAALNVIGGEDDYDLWIRLGQACHGISDHLLGAWKQWSRNGAKYKEGDCEAKWKTFGRRSGLGVATLCYLADQTGQRWRPERKPDPRVDLSGIMNGKPSNNGHQENNGHQANETPEEWPDPIPLAADDAAECPIDAIPETPRNYLLQLAEATQTPVDLSVGMWLAAVGVAVQKKFAIEPSTGWREQLSFYCLMAMEPGNRKSAVATAIGQPIREYENSLRESAAPIIRAAKAESELRSKQRNRLLDDASKAQSEADRGSILYDLKQLDEEIAANPIPCEPSLLVDDVTPEHLATISARNRGRIGILTAEGDFFDIVAGRYSKNPNIGFFLKAHCGDEHRVDRGNRPSELIKSPAMSVGFCVQPSVLRGLLAQDTFRGRGLLARLLPIVPRTLLGHRKINPDPVDPFVELGYRNQMGRMLRMPSEEIEDDIVPQILKLNSDAGQVFNEYREEIEVGLRDFGELESIRDWAGKLPGTVARIAAVLHLAKHSDLWPIPQSIDGDTMRDAIRLGRYLTSHSQTAFQLMGADENRALAEHLIGVIKRHDLREFNRSKIHTITRRRVSRPEDLDKPLSILVDHDFLREVETKPVGKGRKPTQLYTANPNLFREGA